MSGNIFVSYRRDDTAGYAGRITDRLEREFGRDRLFVDVDSIPLGIDFPQVLSEAVAKCGVLLALIGPNWLEARDENNRLENPEDFVKIEIAAALRRNVPVIPILFDGSQLPKTNQLPKELNELARRNALEVRHASFQRDMDKLISYLRRHFGENPPTRKPDELVEEGGAYDLTADDLFMLGRLKKNKDKREASRLLRLAADKGHVEAQYELGLLYAQPWDVPEAIRLLRLAANQGHAQAAYELVRFGEEGEKFDLLRLAAEKGHTEALDELVSYYERHGYKERDDARLADEIFRVLRLAAADQGDARGDFRAQGRLRRFEELKGRFEMTRRVQAEFEERQKAMELAEQSKREAKREARREARRQRAQRPSDPVDRN